MLRPPLPEQPRRWHIRVTNVPLSIRFLFSNLNNHLVPTVSADPLAQAAQANLGFSQLLIKDGYEGIDLAGIPTPWHDDIVCIRSQLAACAPDKLRVAKPLLGILKARFG
jgi:hypothetical protein